MPRKISTLLNLSSETLDFKGVFDGFVDIDSKLHIDPSLLRIKEFKSAYKHFKDYFKIVLLLVSKIQFKNDTFWKESHKRLQFKEISNVALVCNEIEIKGSDKITEDLINHKSEIKDLKSK